MGIVSGMVERRGQLQNPDRWFINMVGGEETKAGVRVDEDAAMSSTAVFAAVRMIAETWASVPLPVYYRRPDGGKDVARDHALYPVLHDSPNPELTSLELREMLAAHCLLGGTCYAQKIRDGSGRVVELWPLTPHRVSAVRSPSGALFFQVRLPNSEEDAILPAADVFWMRGFSRHGLVGERTHELMRESIGLTLAMEKFGSAFFGSGTHLGGVLETPPGARLTDEARKHMRESWERAHTGIDRAHRVALLEEGTAFKALGVEPGKAQFLEGRKFQVSEVARIFNIPPHLLRDLDRATFGNIEQQSIEFVVYTMRPWLVRGEQAYNMRVLSAADRKAGFFVEHKIDGLLRGDIQARFAAYQIGLNNGTLSPNDVRDMENMNRYEGGDVYFVNGANVPVDMMRDYVGGKAAPTPEEQPDPPARSALPAGVRETAGAAVGVEQRAMRSAKMRRTLQQAQVEVFRAAGERVVKREVRSIERALALVAEGRVAEFLVWMEQFYEDHREQVVRIFGPALRAYSESIRAEIVDEMQKDDPSSDFDEFVVDYIDGFATRHVAKSKGQLKAVMREAAADPAAAVRERLEEWSEKRAEKIARNETVRGGNALSKALYVALGVTMLVWRTFGDSCPLCKSMNGKRVGVRQNFLDGGTVLDVEGSSPFVARSGIGHPPLHGGCDCGLVPGTIFG